VINTTETIVYNIVKSTDSSGGPDYMCEDSLINGVLASKQVSRYTGAQLITSCYLSCSLSRYQSSIINISSSIHCCQCTTASVSPLIIKTKSNQSALPPPKWFRFNVKPIIIIIILAIILSSGRQKYC